MAAFRFRAQPALELRRREHEAAQRVLARADAERQRARDRLHASERGVAEAQREADAAGRSSGAHDSSIRFWIVRLEQERGALRTALQAREEAVVAARAGCLAAGQRRDALERFRDKAYEAHVAAERAAERRVIDELATQRHSVRRVITEGA